MNAASVKGKLKNIARESGKSFQGLLISYGLERTIYRLSVSNYKENFILKGGIFYYALYDGDYPRATSDIDFLACNISNDPDSIKTVFREIFLLPGIDDPLIFDPESLAVENIAEQKKYHGINVSITAMLDRTKIPVSVDIGFGDKLYPEKVLMDFPIILSDESPEVYAYSVCSSIAEKFEAIVSLGFDNSRFKDFYDIYVNASKREFDGATLLESFRETFENRNTDIGEIVAFEDEYVTDPLRVSRWNNFAKKKKISLSITLEDTSFRGRVLHANTAYQVYSLHFLVFLYSLSDASFSRSQWHIYDRNTYRK